MRMPAETVGWVRVVRILDHLRPEHAQSSSTSSPPIGQNHLECTSDGAVADLECVRQVWRAAMEQLKHVPSCTHRGVVDEPCRCRASLTYRCGRGRRPGTTRGSDRRRAGTRAGSPIRAPVRRASTGTGRARRTRDVVGTSDVGSQMPAERQARAGRPGWGSDRGGRWLVRIGSSGRGRAASAGSSSSMSSTYSSRPTTVIAGRSTAVLLLELALVDVERSSVESGAPESSVVARRACDRGCRQGIRRQPIAGTAARRQHDHHEQHEAGRATEEEVPALINGAQSIDRGHGDTVINRSAGSVAARRIRSTGWSDRGGVRLERLATAHEVPVAVGAVDPGHRREVLVEPQRTDGKGCLLRRVGPVGVVPADRRSCVGRVAGRCCSSSTDPSAIAIDLGPDRQHRVAEAIELAAIFALGRFDHQRARPPGNSSSERGTRSRSAVWRRRRR